MFVKFLIEQKGMTFDHDFCYSFSIFFPFFRREEKMEKKNLSCNQKSCLSARSTPFVCVKVPSFSQIYEEKNTFHCNISTKMHLE